MSPDFSEFRHHLSPSSFHKRFTGPATIESRSQAIGDDRDVDRGNTASLAWGTASDEAKRTTDWLQFSIKALTGEL